jgi:hypothetical protein
MLRAADAAHGAIIKKALAGFVMPHRFEMPLIPLASLCLLILTDRLGNSQQMHAKRFAMAGFVPSSEMVSGMVRRNFYFVPHNFIVICIPTTRTSSLLSLPSSCVEQNKSYMTEYSTILMIFTYISIPQQYNTNRSVSMRVLCR